MERVFAFAAEHQTIQSENAQRIYATLFTKICCIEMPNFAMHYLYNNIKEDDSLDISNINLV